MYLYFSMCILHGSNGYKYLLKTLNWIKDKIIYFLSLIRALYSENSASSVWRLQRVKHIYFNVSNEMCHWQKTTEQKLKWPIRTAIAIDEKLSLNLPMQGQVCAIDVTDHCTQSHQNDGSTSCILPLFHICMLEGWSYMPNFMV